MLKAAKCWKVWGTSITQDLNNKLQLKSKTILMCDKISESKKSS